ncbi:MAG TPA: aconitase/3-isopropylmalate dehydratase large subunit family protein [Candidatus Thermoplasmatota archaeon]|nr:aconitase/3-isopropylmalate dehydratase large subunit family protein [Candidatus Thermoplasmatota archaeon]
MAGMTLAEKILAAHSGRPHVKPGDILDVKVDTAMGHEATAQAAPQFRKMGATKVWDPERVMIVLDHWVPASTDGAVQMHADIRKFVKEVGIKHFYDIGRHGICHQMLAEEGWEAPGDVIIGSDSHTNMGGGLGAFAAGVGPTEIASVWATGELWVRVPTNFKVEVSGRLGEHVYAKDVILRTAKLLTCEGGRYKALEFMGDTIKRMPVHDRLTVCNMTTELGAKTGIIAGDEVARAYLTGRYRRELRDPFPVSDEDAVFQEEVAFDVTGMEPQLACPNSPDNVKGISEVVGVKLDQAFVGSCTNARIEDLRIAAQFLKGEKVAPSCRVIISPASTSTYNQALKEGLIEVFTDAGAVFTVSSCSACFGGHIGKIGKTEVAISSSNRNFPGRMGHRESQVYLASPAVVAASALYGEITDPRKIGKKVAVPAT